MKIEVMTYYFTKTIENTDLNQLFRKQQML